jgi:glycosyltransferase involved in cell wall biosynthesis
MKRLCILLMNDDYPPRGRSSVASIVATLAGGYRDMGHDVHVITTHRTEENPETLRKDGTTSLPSSYRISLRQYRSLYAPSMSKMLEREIRAIRPDVVHAHNLHTHLTYDALRVAHRFTPNVFITLHDVMSFAAGRLTTERFLRSGGRDARLTIGDHIRSGGLQWNPLRNQWIRRRLKLYTRRVIAVSKSLRHALEQHGIPHLTVIPNGVDLEMWQAREEEIASIRSRFGLAGRRTILFGGRLSTDKGTRELLRALALLRRKAPDVLLLVAGDEARWKALVADARIEEDLSDCWRCTGWLTREEMRAVTFAADIATTPSVCLDTFNLMNIEAMAAKKPVVGTCFGGTPEIVVDGESGLIVDPRNSVTYAGALLTLLSDPMLRRRMGEAGRKRVEEHFSAKNMTRNYLALYSQSS